MRANQPPINHTTRRPRFGTRMAPALVVLVLLAAACSSGDDTGAPESPDASAEATTTTGASGDTPSDDSSSGGESVSRAEVIVDGETYVFQDEGFLASTNCRPNDFGAFHALISYVDENEEPLERSELRAEFIRDDADDDSGLDNEIFITFGYLDVNFDMNFIPGWSASAALAEQYGHGVGQVDSYQIDGNVVSGTATFISSEQESAFLRGDAATVDGVEGSFTITCSSG